MTMNGINGSAKGDQGYQSWKVGLISFTNKYMTAESFGFKINVSGTTLKKKQTFWLEQDPKEEVVYIRSHTGRYLSADKYGKVSCETERDEKGNAEKFTVEYDKAGSGRWSFKNVAYDTYLCGKEEDFHCFSKQIGEAEKWVVQLSIHPQVSLKNVNRKRYAHLKDEQLQVTEPIPWGKEALIILHFDNGRYGLKTYDNRFLNSDGTLSSELTNNNVYTLELRSGANSGLAFRDSTGTYLTAVGSTATMKGRNKTVSRDELFLLEDSCPQVVLTSVQNKKMVSVKQGIDVTANISSSHNDSDDVENETSYSNKEIFQLELVVEPTEEKPGKWCFRTKESMYWTLDNLAGVQANARDPLNLSTQFEVEWQGDGTIALKANNGSYVQAKQTGQLVASSDSITNKERFYVKIINRPLLLLKNEHGFIGLKAPTKTEVQCSKTNYEIILLEPADDGYYFIKGMNRKYWRVQEDASICADGETPEKFLLEPRSSSIMTIKAENGCYIKGEQNGLLRAVGQEVDSSMLWEY